MKLPLKLDVTAHAIFSHPDGCYRYLLRREWSPDLGRVVWICLNPSTATEEEDDPTVAKLQIYARLWGYGSISVLNLFALRSTFPEVMKKHREPVGPLNDAYILDECHNAGLVMAAWGNDGQHLQRSATVRALLRDENTTLYCLKRNKNGEPAHPLYQPLSALPQIY